MSPLWYRFMRSYRRFCSIGGAAEALLWHGLDDGGHRITRSSLRKLTGPLRQPSRASSRHRFGGSSMPVQRCPPSALLHQLGDQLLYSPSYINLPHNVMPAVIPETYLIAENQSARAAQHLYKPAYLNPFCIPHQMIQTAVAPVSAQTISGE
jgi:hypothetical protein